MPSEQLHLPVPPSEEGPALHLPNRVVPMQATQVDAPFDDADYFFEPWWPGVRAFALAVQRGLVMTPRHVASQASALRLAGRAAEVDSLLAVLGYRWA